MPNELKPRIKAIHRADVCTGEAPLWDHRFATIWWIDIQGQRLLGYRPSDGAELAFHVPSMIGMVQLWRNQLLIGLEDGIYSYDPKTESGKLLLPVEPDISITRINESCVDAKGRLWFGTMDKTGSGDPVGNLYRVDVGGTLVRVRTDIRVPNGLDFSPDGRQMYFCDSRTGTFEEFDYDLETGTPTFCRVLKQYEGETVDGVCVDAEGAIWVAVLGGSRLERLFPDGSLDFEIALPVSRPTMPALGGPDSNSIYVTSQRRPLTFAESKTQPFAGDLLEITVNVSPMHARLVTCF